MVIKTLVTLLDEWCAANPGYLIKYIDLDPKLHAQAPFARMQVGWLYKTKLCASSPCRLGPSRCNFAHGVHELRVPSSGESTPRYFFSAVLTQPDEEGPPLDFRNENPYFLKADAKLELAKHAVHALGLRPVKADGSDGSAGGAVRLELDESWIKVQRRSARPSYAESNALSDASYTCSTGADTSNTKTELSQWQKRVLIEKVYEIVCSKKACAAARESYDVWIAHVGGQFGSFHPQLAKLVRVHYGSFRCFVEKHGGQVGMGVSKRAAQSHAVPESPAQPATPASIDDFPKLAELQSSQTVTRVPALAASSALTSASASTSTVAAASAAELTQATAAAPAAPAAAATAATAEFHTSVASATDGLSCSGTSSDPALTCLLQQLSECEDDGAALRRWLGTASGSGRGGCSGDGSVDNSDSQQTGGPRSCPQHPHAVVYEIIRDCGDSGIDFCSLRATLEKRTSHLLTRNIKPFALATYVQAFPAVFSVQTDAHGTVKHLRLADTAAHRADSPDNDRLQSRSCGSAAGSESKADEVDGAQQTLEQHRTALFTAGIGDEALRQMSVAGLVALGVPSDLAPLLLIQTASRATQRAGAVSDDGGRGGGQGVGGEAAGGGGAGLSGAAVAPGASSRADGGAGPGHPPRAGLGFVAAPGTTECSSHTNQASTGGQSGRGAGSANVVRGSGRGLGRGGRGRMSVGQSSIEHRTADEESSNRLVTELQALVETLQQQTAALEARNFELETRDFELESQHSELTSQHSALQARASELELRTSELEATVSSLKEARLCIICQERKRETVVLPCMHALFCGICLRAHGANAKSCPVCRGFVSGLLDCKFDLGSDGTG